MEFIRPDINLDFVGKRRLAFIVSGLLVLMTVVSLVLHGGPNYGIDFAGGILIQVRFDKPTDAAAIKKALAPIGMGDSLVQHFGREGNEFLIRAEKQGLKLQGLADKVRKVLKDRYGEGFEVRRVEMVGPKVGRDLLLTLIFSIVLGLLVERFRADAVVHFGTHGTEFLFPTKATGLSPRDWPDVLLGDMPNLNPWIINNLGDPRNPSLEHPLDNRIARLPHPIQASIPSLSQRLIGPVKPEPTDNYCLATKDPQQICL